MHASFTVAANLPFLTPVADGEGVTEGVREIEMLGVTEGVFEIEMLGVVDGVTEGVREIEMLGVIEIVGVTDGVLVGVGEGLGQVNGPDVASQLPPLFV